MAEIKKIPAEPGWKISPGGSTGACMAFSNALRQAIGEAAHNEFNDGIWYQAGMRAKEFVEAFGLPVGDARQIEEAMELAIRASMWPEFEFEVVEATRSRCVARVLKCAWYERCKEQGISWDFCSVGHGRWGEGFIASVNPDFAFSLPRTAPGGDPYCEFIIEWKG